MDRQNKLIKITHIINPSRFYCRDVDLQDTEVKQIMQIEKRLSDLAEKPRNSMNEFYEPVPGDVSL